MRNLAYLLMGIGGAGGLVALVMTANRTLRPAADFDPVLPGLVLLGFVVMIVGAGLRSRAAAQAALGATLCILGMGLIAAGLWVNLPMDVYVLSATTPSKVQAVTIILGLICLVGGVYEFAKSPLREVLPRLKR